MYLATSGAFGYPSENQAKVYCNSFRSSLVANFALLIAMHCVTAACYYTLKSNDDRDSMHHPALDFSEEQVNNANAVVRSSIDGGMTGSTTSSPFFKPATEKPGAATPTALGAVASASTVR